MPPGLPLVAARHTRIGPSDLERIVLLGGLARHDRSTGCHVGGARGDQFGVEPLDGVEGEASSDQEREQGILHRGEHAVSQLLEKIQELRLLPGVLPRLHLLPYDMGSVLRLRDIRNSVKWRDRFLNMAERFVLRFAVDVVCEDVHNGRKIQNSQGGAGKVE